MVASQFIIWTGASTAMFVVFLIIMIVLLGIAALGITEHLGILMAIPTVLGLALFGLLGVLVPHHWAVSQVKSQQSYANIRAEYPHLIVYNTSISEQWAWVRWKGCASSKAVQVPMYRQPDRGNTYWLTSPQLVVDKPTNHDNMAGWDIRKVIPPAASRTICYR